MTKDDDVSDGETAGETAADDGRTDDGRAGTETLRTGETTEDIVHRQGEDSSDEPES